LYWVPSSCLYMAQLLIVLEILQKPLGSTVIVLEILQKPLGSTPYFLGRLREIESGKGTPFVHPTRYYYHRVHGNTAQLLIVLEILQKPLGSTVIVLEILQKPWGVLLISLEGSER
jgi:hypothetical protein